MPTVVLHLTRTFSGARRAVELANFPVKYHRQLTQGQVAEVELDWPALVKLLGELDKAPDAARALGLGRALRAALLPSGWEGVEGSLAAALQGGEATLVIQTNADELYALPWEAMPLGLNGPPLAEVPNLTVLYHEPGVSAPLAPVDPPRAALLAWSAGGKTVPHARVAQTFGPTRTLAEPSLDQLVSALRRGEHDALVLLAHGGRTKRGVALQWGDERLTPAQLVAKLRKLPRLPAWVVVLACRAGAEHAESIGFGGFGLELHRLGVALVMASRWTLSFSGAPRAGACPRRRMGA
ncbi:MAG: hypothetical protein IPN01_17485 [Deltaproteobacteria bacterium]|nr:hypothetical protein [Deltaproteobacteria bacterium]